MQHLYVIPDDVTSSSEKILKSCNKKSTDRLESKKEIRNTTMVSRFLLF